MIYNRREWRTVLAEGDGDGGDGGGRVMAALKYTWMTANKENYDRGAPMEKGSTTTKHQR